MNDPTKNLKMIFAIEHGEYSDYSVDALFEDEATAKAWASAMNSDEEEKGSGYPYEVQPFILVQAGTEPFKVTTYSQCVELWDDGRVEPRPMQIRSDWPLGTWQTVPPRRPFVRYVRSPGHNSRGGRLEVIGNSEKTVAKVVGEKIAMWKAGAWGGPGHEELVEGGKFFPRSYEPKSS